MAEPAGSNLLAGLTNKSPPGVDASMKCKGPSVDADAVRTSTAPQPATLGPRTA